MYILGIDSSGISSTISIVTENKVLGEFTINNKKTHAELLMPLLESLLKFLELNINDINYIACTNGPGSFTGLRIGGAMAKSIAHGLNIPIIPISSLDCLAYNIFDVKSIIVPIIDAKRNQVYTAYFNYKLNKLNKFENDKILEIEKVLEQCENFNEKIIFVGDGSVLYKNEIINFSKNFYIGNNNQNLEKASSVGCLGFFNLEKAVSYNNLELSYLRLSQAEREYKGN